MENENSEELEIDEQMDNMPKSEHKFLNRVVNGFQTIPNGFRKTASDASKAQKAVSLMKKMIVYSQNAQKLYWDTHNMKTKTAADFDKADAMVDKALGFMNEVMAEWPQQIPALMPMKEKMLAQKKDIELQRQGIVADVDTLLPPKPQKPDAAKPDMGVTNA